MNKTIISFVGYARVGKDQAAEVAVEEFGYTRFAFADKLRECLLALNPIVVGQDFFNIRNRVDSDSIPVMHPTSRLQDVIDEHTWDGYKSTEFSSEIRALLQRFGTEVGRDLIDQDIWLKELDKVKADKIVITDTRFPNELDYVVNKGGNIVRINRPGFGPINDHISEVAIDDYAPDYYIENAGTLEDYADNIRNVINEIEGR